VAAVHLEFYPRLSRSNNPMVTALYVLASFVASFPVRSEQRFGCGLSHPAEKKMSTEKARENRLRRWAGRLGYALHKDRARSWGVDHRGRYMVVLPSENCIVIGERYDQSLDDVEAFLAEAEAELRARSQGGSCPSVCATSTAGERMTQIPGQSVTTNPVR
jgi:hypothetical protein